MNCSPPGSPSVEFSRKEYWRGLSFPSPGVMESASSAFWFQPIWGLHAGGQNTVNVSHLAGCFCICKTVQRYCSMCPLRGNQDPSPRLHHCFLTPLSPHPLPSLISTCLNPPVGTLGRSWRLNEDSSCRGANKREG